MIATRFQAAVPVSHEFFASPCVGASRPGDHLCVDVRLAAVDLADLLASGRVDAQVVVEGRVAVPGERLGDHDPRVRVAEHAGVLLVAGRVRRDLAELEPVARVRGLQEHDPVRRRQVLAHRGEGPLGQPVVEPDAGHRRTCPAARRRSAPRRSRPSRRERPRSRTRDGTTRRPSRGSRTASAIRSLASRCAAAASGSPDAARRSPRAPRRRARRGPAMNTDSATPPSRFGAPSGTTRPASRRSSSGSGSRSSRPARSAAARAGRAGRACSRASAGDARSSGVSEPGSLSYGTGSWRIETSPVSFR